MEGINNIFFILKTNYLLLLALCFGLFLRLYGIDFGLPFLYHPDESILIERALSFGTGDFNPHFFEWPASVLMYFLFSLYGFYYLILHSLGLVASPGEFAIIFWNDPTNFYLIARTFTALAGTATIYFTYKLGLETYNKKTGIISALIMAVGYYHVRNSHYATTDITMILLLIIAVLFTLRYYKSAKTRHLIFASIFWGLATAVKYTAAYLFFPIFFSIWFLFRNKQVKSYRQLIGLITLSGIIAVSVFFMVTPYALLDFKTFISHVSFQMERLKSGHLGFDAEYSGYVWFFTEILPRMAGLLPAMLLAAGSFYSLFNRKKKVWLLAAFPIFFYLLVLGRGQAFMVRYALVLLPFMAIYTGNFIDSIAGKISYNLRTQKIIISSILIIVFFWPVLRLIEFDIALANEDTRTQAARWIEQNIPAGEKIGLEWFNYSPQLETRGHYLLRLYGKFDYSEKENHKASIEWKYDKVSKYLKGNINEPEYDLYYLWDSEEEMTTDVLKKQRVAYLVLSSSNFKRYFSNYAYNKYPKNSKRDFYTNAMESYTLIKEFKQPSWLKGDPYHYPTIKIYSLNDIK